MCEFQKKMAVINDMSGYGRCSLTVQLPIISSFKIQACPIPTGIFSNHTGYKNYKKVDFTKHLNEYINNWEELNLSFDGICIGYLTSKRQIDFIYRLLEKFKKNDCIVVLDPVMGDNGSLYSGYLEETATSLFEILPHANIITPNLTELCFLSKKEYKKEIDDENIVSMIKKVADLGPKKIVVTGVDKNGVLNNYCYDKENDVLQIVTNEKSGENRPGTGDIFSAIVAADAVNNVDFFASVKRAAKFIEKCVLRSDKRGVEKLDGVCFEDFLNIEIGE